MSFSKLNRLDFTQEVSPPSLEQLLSLLSLCAAPRRTLIALSNPSSQESTAQPDIPNASSIPDNDLLFALLGLDHKDSAMRHARVEQAILVPLSPFSPL